ncbi:MAG: autotransporter domain-containing protein [Proteobacteria bacterium]|nr:autotransporter domain-containing protein [Pseudomonadota bacterium]
MFPRAINVSFSSSNNKRRRGEDKARFTRRMQLAGSSAILALCAAGLPQLAQAANECGVGTSVTCTATGNTYPTGVTYVSPTTQTVDLTSGVVIDSTLTPGLSVTTGTGALNVNGPGGVSITSEATGAAGVLLTSGSGDVAANLDTIVTKGDLAPGARATTGTGSVSLNIGHVTTSGATAEGIIGQAGTGTVNIVSNTVATSGVNAAGIDATVGSGTVTINSSVVATTGNGAVGIVGSAGSGAATINAGSVSTTGANATGVFGLVGSGAVNINAKSVATTGAGAVGIEGVALGPTSTVGIVTSGAVSTAGDNAIGIAALAGGHASVVTNGSVTTAGVNAPAIQVSSGSGAASLNVASGAVTAIKSDAVDLSGDTVDATVGSKASVSGATAGFNISSASGSTLTNAGTIGSSGGYAVLASGGPITIGNSGTITGAVSLTGGDDVFNNSGAFNATKDSDFGAGADVFNNSGTVAVLPAATSAGTVTFTGLEAFNNKGTVSLVNGHAGDSLVLPGTYNGSGVGSTLAVDFAGGSTPVADTLVVGGAATGSTAVHLSSTNGALVVNNLVVASGGAGSSPTAFTIDPASANNGFVGYQVVYDAGAGTYALVGTPNAAVNETLKVQELVSNFWGQSADAWSVHMAQARDAHFAGAGWQGIHGWGQFYGGGQDRDAVQTRTTFGVTETNDLSYDSTYYGFQGGIDAVSGMWTFGLTAGYSGADMRFLATQDKTFVEGYNIGAYAGLQTGGLFLHVLAKYNGDQIRMGSLLVPSVLDFHGHSYGGRVEGGYRFGGADWFIEPIASFDYTRTFLDNLSAFDSAFNFDRYDSELGKAGVRFGGTLFHWGPAAIQPYASVVAVHDWRGTDGFVFSNGGFDFGYNNDRRGTYGHASAGVNLIALHGVDGYLQTDLDFANGTHGAGGRIGIRFAF